MTFVPIADAATQTGIAEDVIRDWVARKRLSEVGGNVDPVALAEIARMENVAHRADQLDAALAVLGDKIPAPDPLWLKVLPVLVGLLGTVIGLVALGVSNGQLQVATDAAVTSQQALDQSRQAFEAQTKAMQVQTAHDYQMELLQTFRDLSATSETAMTQADTLSMIYQEQLLLGQELAIGESIAPDFWAKFSGRLCSSWKAQLCEIQDPYYAGVARQNYPQLSEICLPDEAGDQMICS